jgi:hypothetical protein
MVIIMEPQLELVHEAGVTGAAGAAGAGVGDEADIPPPQALKAAAISKEQAAPGNH